MSEGKCWVCSHRTEARCDTCETFLCRFCGTRYHLCYGAWYRECPPCTEARVVYERELADVHRLLTEANMP